MHCMPTRPLEHTVWLVGEAPSPEVYVSKQSVRIVCGSHKHQYHPHIQFENLHGIVCSIEGLGSISRPLKYIDKGAHSATWIPFATNGPLFT